MSVGMSYNDEYDDESTKDNDAEQCNNGEEYVNAELSERSEDFSIDAEPTEIGSETEGHNDEEPITSYGVALRLWVTILIKNI